MKHSAVRVNMLYYIIGLGTLTIKFSNPNHFIKELEIVPLGTGSAINLSL